MTQNAKQPHQHTKPISPWQCKSQPNKPKSKSTSSDPIRGHFPQNPIPTKYSTDSTSTSTPIIYTCIDAVVLVRSLKQVMVQRGHVAISIHSHKQYFSTIQMYKDHASGSLAGTPAHMMICTYPPKRNDELRANPSKCNKRVYLSIHYVLAACPPRLAN